MLRLLVICTVLLAMLILLAGVAVWRTPSDVRRKAIRRKGLVVLFLAGSVVFAAVFLTTVSALLAEVHF